MTQVVLVPGQVIVVRGFMDKDECARHIESSESRGYEIAPVTTAQGAILRPDIRKNDRVIFDDAGLAVDLWQRIQPFVPSPFEGRNAIGLNERFRFYRYDPSQTFSLHKDGCFRRPNSDISQWTFMVYLNDGFAGGATHFDLAFPHGDIHVVPETGMALLFYHYLWHEGVAVARGRKYVLRTDVMFGALMDGYVDE